MDSFIKEISSCWELLGYKSHEPISSMLSNIETFKEGYGSLAQRVQRTILIFRRNHGMS